MSKKLAAKARLVQLPELPPRAASGARPAPAQPAGSQPALPPAPAQDSVPGALSDGAARVAERAAAQAASAAPVSPTTAHPPMGSPAVEASQASQGADASPRAQVAQAGRRHQSAEAAPPAEDVGARGLQAGGRAGVPPSAGGLPAAPSSGLAQGPGDTAHETRPAATRPRTAPGAMAVFMASQSAALKEVDALRAQLQAFDGASPVRPLDPLLVRPSRWANRHEQSFADAAFTELKADIAAAGGNVQPVCVRPLPGVLNGSTAEGAPAYELVFGHRRHRACLELGLPVQAMVTALDDRALFEAMERENRARKNLSAYEQGTMYKRALDDGLYPSQRRLAEALGVDISLVSKSLSLARLPEAVVAAFGSPLDIQFRWAQPLAEALQKDPDGVLARAARLRVQGSASHLAPAQVLAALLAPPAGGGEGAGTTAGPAAQRVIDGKAGRRAVLTRGPKGQLTVAFSPGALNEAAEADLASHIEKLLGRR